MREFQAVLLFVMLTKTIQAALTKYQRLIRSDACWPFIRYELFNRCFDAMRCSFGLAGGVHIR